MPYYRDSKNRERWRPPRWDDDLGKIVKIKYVKEDLGKVVATEPKYLVLEKPDGSKTNIWYKDIRTVQYGPRMKKEYEELSEIDWNIDV